MVPVRSITAFTVIVGLMLMGTLPVHGETPWKDIKIPNKLGFGLSLYNQNQPYQIKSLELGVGGIDGSTLTELPVQNSTTSTHFRVDYWVLPFLNVFGLVGNIDSATNVDLKDFDIGLPVGFDDLKINNDGTVYGAGLVLAVGGKRWFGALAYDYTETELSVTTSSVNAQIITPKIGLHFDGGAVWIGAMHQNIEEVHEGTYDLPFLGAIPYRVVLEAKQPWNYTIGGTAGLTKHLVLMLQGGFGDRKSALVTLEYRIF